MLKRLFTEGPIEKAVGVESTNQSDGRPSVNVHKNAKLTPAGRVLLVQRVLFEHQSVGEVSRLYKDGNDLTGR